MLEMLIRPRTSEKAPWKMLFVGLVYGIASLMLVKFFFGADPVLSKYSGMMVVLFCVMFSTPYMYFLFKREEEEDETVEGFFVA